RRAFDSVINIVLHGSAYCALGAGKRWIEGQAPRYDPFDTDHLSVAGQSLHGSVGNREGWRSFHDAEPRYRMGYDVNPRCDGRTWNLSHPRRIGEALPGPGRIRSAGRARPGAASGTARRTRESLLISNVRLCRFYQR